MYLFINLLKFESPVLIRRYFNNFNDFSDLQNSRIFTLQSEFDEEAQILKKEYDIERLVPGNASTSFIGYSFKGRQTSNVIQFSFAAFLFQNDSLTLWYILKKRKWIFYGEGLHYFQNSKNLFCKFHTHLATLTP